MARKKGQQRRQAYRKTGNGPENRTGKRKSRQKGGFLHRSDFSYAGRDTVNQVDKIASGKNYWRNRQNCTKKDKSSYQVWRRRD